MGDDPLATRIAGRPPLHPNVARSERVVTFLTPAERQSLGEFAERTSQSISTATQTLIVRSLTEDDSAPQETLQQEEP